jgi:hypothetical protein
VPTTTASTSKVLPSKAEMPCFSYPLAYSYLPIFLQWHLYHFQKAMS